MKACHLPDIYCAMYGTRDEVTHIICNYCGGYREFNEPSPPPPSGELSLAKQLCWIAIVWEPGVERRRREQVEIDWYAGYR